MRKNEVIEKYFSKNFIVKFYMKYATWFYLMKINLLKALISNNLIIISNIFKSCFSTP